MSERFSTPLPPLSSIRSVRGRLSNPQTGEGDGQLAQSPFLHALIPLFPRPLPLRNRILPLGSSLRRKGIRCRRPAPRTSFTTLMCRGLTGGLLSGDIQAAPMYVGRIFEIFFFRFYRSVILCRVFCRHRGGITH